MKAISYSLSGLCLAALLACGTADAPTETSTPDASGNTETSTPTDDSTSDTSSDDSNTADESNTETDDTSTATPADASELAPLFEGTYAYKRSVTTAQEVPMLGRSEIVTISWGYTNINWYSGQIWYTEYGCHVESGGSSAVEVEIPDIIAQTIEPKGVELRVWQDGETVHWERPETVTLLGVNLDDPIRDELPENPDDSRVYDQDGDGNPGVTVKVGGFISGDLYVIQRTTNTYTGTLDDAGSLIGSIEEFGEQKIMGATNAMLEQDIPSEHLNDPAVNTIKLVPVDSSITCQWLMENADTLF